MMSKCTVVRSGGAQGDVNIDGHITHNVGILHWQALTAPPSMLCDLPLRDDTVKLPQGRPHGSDNVEHEIIVIYTVKEVVRENIGR